MKNPKDKKSLNRRTKKIKKWLSRSEMVMVYNQESIAMNEYSSEKRIEKKTEVSSY
jgi:hypothetical protein